MRDQEHGGIGAGRSQRLEDLGLGAGIQGGRRFVEQALYEALARSSRNDAEPEAVRERLRNAHPVREALDWMWPVLTPAQLLHDLFGSRALLRSAAGTRLRA